MIKYHIFGGVFLSDNKEKIFQPSLLLRAITFWVIVAAALLLCASTLLSTGAVELASTGYISSAVSFISAVAAGYASADSEKGTRLLSGLLYGLIISGLLLLIGFIIRGSLNRDAVLSCLCFTISGCLFGAFIHKRKKRRSIRLPGR